MMIKIKYFVGIISLFLLSFSCKSSKIQSKLPFKLLQSTYYHWSGGQAGVKGTNVVIKGLKTNLNNFIADSIYFNNKAVKVETHIKKDSIILIGYFSAPRPVVYLELEPNQKKTTPKFIPKNPYHLNKNEVVLTYFLNGKKRFYKLTGLVETNKKYYP